MRPTSITRRAALGLLMGAAGSTLMSRGTAEAITQDDIDKTEKQLAEAEKKLDEIQEQLDQIAEQYETLSLELSDTLSQMDEVNTQIASTEQEIAEKEAELKDKRATLSRRIRSSYKSGGDSVLESLFMAGSLAELGSNIYYLDKISSHDRQLIESVDRLKTELEDHKSDLEDDLAVLDGLRILQEQKLSDMQAKQDEVQAIFEGLDEDVKDLISQRDAEILQLAKEREEQRKREEEAAAKAGGVYGSYLDGTTTGSQARVIAACKTTGSPGYGLCAMWVSMVFSNAGFPYAGGNANDMYNAWTTSSNRADLKPGMIVAVSTHSHTSAGRIYGHIGIYIGDGIMMDNIGYIRTISVNEWIRFYSTTVTPRWGWLMGIKLA